MSRRRKGKQEDEGDDGDTDANCSLVVLSIANVVFLSLLT